LAANKGCKTEAALFLTRLLAVERAAFPYCQLRRNERVLRAAASKCGIFAGRELCARRQGGTQIRIKLFLKRFESNERTTPRNERWLLRIQLRIQLCIDAPWSQFGMHKRPVGNLSPGTSKAGQPARPAPRTSAGEMPALG
jgi:hypothetical protein